MAIAQPAFVAFEEGQDGTWTVSLDPAEDVTSWTVECNVRAYNGGTALITKDTDSSSEINVSDTSNGVFVVQFSASDLTLLYGPGVYVVQLHRTNSGYRYPITDPSPLLLRPADSSTYPTLTNLGEYAAHALLGITLTDAMAQQIIQLLASAEARIKRYCNRDFVYRASVTEYYAGNGTQELRLRRRPVHSIGSLYLDYGGYGGTPSGSFASTTQLTSGTDFWLVKDDLDNIYNEDVSHSGIVERIGHVWPSKRFRPLEILGHQRRPHRGCIKVTYTGGYRQVPHDLKQAVWDLTSYMEAGSVFGRIPQSESGEGYSRSFGGTDEGGIPVQIRAVLDSYRDGRAFVA